MHTKGRATNSIQSFTAKTLLNVPVQAFSPAEQQEARHSIILFCTVLSCI